jgi:beta-lactamase regulating signal transducer with metallopeptidase domain
MSLPPGLADRLLWLLNHSLQAGVLVLLVLLVQWLLRRQFTNRWRFALWWLVLLRLLLPFNPSSALSLFNIVHPSVHLPAVAMSRQSPGDQVFNVVPPSAHVDNPPEADLFSDLGSLSPIVPAPSTTESPVQETTPVPSPIHFTLPMILTALWLTGIVLLISIVATQLSRFYRQLSSGATPANDQLRALFDECRAEFQVTRKIDLLETDAVQSPALFGLFRLRLLLPRGLDTQFNRPELRYIFLHELAHVKRGDLWLNWLVTVLQILHWFNPLLWFGFARLRADRELACDELALLRAGDQAGTAYGETVIKLLENLSRPAAIPGLIGILEDRRAMRRRITMIAGFHRPGRWSLLAVLLLAALAAFALTDAQSDQPAHLPHTNIAGEDVRNSSLTPNQSPYDDYYTPENNMPHVGFTSPLGTNAHIWESQGGRSKNTPETLAVLRSRMLAKARKVIDYEGTVLLPDGQPAANVDVALQIENWEDIDWYLGKGKFKDREDLHRHGFLVSTGPDGSFKLGLAAHAVSILALDERGCAQVSLEQLRQNPQITLQKWGRIEGWLTIGGRPASNELVSVTHWDFIHGTNATPGPMYSPDAIAAKTDAGGHFVLSHVPPGEQILGRRGTPAEGEFFRMSSVLEVAPGTTVVTNLEDNSRAVIVRLKHNDAGRSEDEISDIVVIETSALLELQKKYTPIRTGADRQAFHNDAEKIRSQIRAYGAFPQPDGSFRADGIPPGEYYVHLEEPDSTNRAFIRSEHTLVVPSETGDQVAIPVDWGEVNLIDDRPRVPAQKTIEPNSATNSSTKTDGAPEQATTSQPPSSKAGSEDTLKGVILLPNGQPATNAQVAVPFLGSGLRLGLGEIVFSPAGSEDSVVRTAPDGSFTIPTYRGGPWIVALNKDGFAQMSVEQFRAAPQLKLQKWGRIKGQLIIDHHARPDEMVMLHLSAPPGRFATNGPSSLSGTMNFPVLFYFSDAFQARTDDQGRFDFTFVPPGEHMMMHVIPQGKYGLIFSELERVDVKPGATAVIKVGGTGRTVTGRIKIDNGTAADLQDAQIHLRIDTSFTNDLEPQGGFRLYAAVPKLDGSFRAEDVAPGLYTIRYTIRTSDSGTSRTASFYQPPVKWYIPPAKDDQDDSPVNWGEIQLTKKFTWPWSGPPTHPAR